MRNVISASWTSSASRITTTPTERQRAREQGDHAVGDQAVERLHVVGHPRDQHAGPAAGEEPDRHRLQVDVDPLAQVLQRPLTDPADEVGLRVGGAPVERDRGDEDDDDHGQGAGVAGQDPVVDRLPGQERRRERRGGRDQQRDQHQDHLGRGRGATGRAASAPCARAGPRRGSAARGRGTAAACRPASRAGSTGPRSARRAPSPCVSGSSPFSTERRAASGRRRSAHSHATSSRSSRSRCRKSTSSQPNSAISA